MHFILLYYPLKKINYYTWFKILHRTVICPSMTPFASRCQCWSRYILD